MLGKANEVKCKYISGFDHFTISDCGIPEDANVIDIKFSTCNDEGVVRESVLIIYKQNPQECEDCGKPWKLGDPTSEVEERRIKCLCKECF